MLAKIEQLLQEIEGLQAANAEELEALRIKYLSKKGAINELMADFRNVPAEQKKEVGMKLNELKNKAQERIATLKEVFETQDNGAAEMDLTRTAYPIELGTRHPLSIVKNEIIDISWRDVVSHEKEFRRKHKPRFKTYRTSQYLTQVDDWAWQRWPTIS